MVTLILDNGITHGPEQLEGWLREQEVACEGHLHFQVHWLPPNASWLDQIEIWFSLREPQTFAAQSLSQHGCPGNFSQRVPCLLQPNGQTDQLDLYRREA